MLITPFAGLIAPEENDPSSVDNNAFFEINPTVTDQFLKIGAVTHRHDAHPALPSPTTPMTGSVSVSGGALQSSTQFFVTYTLVDAYGGETAASSALALTTPDGIGAPTDLLVATPDNTGGILPAGDYFYAKTYTDGAGGETPIGPFTLVYVDPGFASAQVQISNLMADAPGTAVTARLWRSYEGADWHLVTETGSDTYTDAGFDPPDNPALPPETDNTNQTNLLSVLIPSDPAMTSACVAIKVYFSSDGGFPNPSFLEQVPTASAGAVLTITSMTVSAGAPPPVSRASRGAAKINPDTDMLDFPWKRPVMLEANLPSTGNGLGDVRLVIRTMVLYGWSEDNVWVPLCCTGSGGSGGGPSGTISPSSIPGDTSFGTPTLRESLVGITTVTPSRGPTSGGTAITIIGRGFVDPATVVIGQGTGPTPDAIPCTDVVVVSPTEITAVTGAEPSGLPGPYHVWVTDALGVNFQLPSYVDDVWTYGPVFAHDTFTGSGAVDLSTHTPEIGISWTNFDEGTAGEMEVSSGKVRAVDANHVTYYTLHIAPDPDYEVTIDTIGGLASSAVGVWARFDPTAWGGYLLQQVDGTLSLLVGTAGTFTTLASSAQVADETITLRVEGDTISAIVDGTTVFSVTDSTYTAPGHAGLRGWYNGTDNAQGDNFTAQTLTVAEFVHDSFTDSDGTLLTAHTGELGATWTDHPSASPFSPQIVSNRVDVNTDGGSETRAFASGVPPAADYTVKADFLSPMGSPAFGYADLWIRLSETDNTGILLRYNSHPGGGVDPEFQFFNASAGVFTESGSGYIVPLPVTVTITCVGAIATARLADGTVVGTITDSDPTAVGRVGVGVSGSGTEGQGVYVDNISAYTLT